MVVFGFDFSVITEAHVSYGGFSCARIAIWR
jgi:hypothetical protein